MTLAETLAAPSVFPWVCLIVGLLVGSFLNVVIHRLPRMMERAWRQQCAELTGAEAEAGESGTYNLIVPRSACPSCGTPIKAVHNIPVLSYLWLRGQCADCKVRISPRYVLVEIFTGLLSGFLAWWFGPTAAAFAAIVLTWALVVLTCIDIDTQLLPDSITLPLVWLGLLINVAGVFTDLRSAVIGAAAGYMVLWSVYWLFKLLTGKEGMGYGDFKLLAAIGAWLGWQMLPLTILLSALVGAVVGIGLIVFARHGKSVPIPFGPYLAGAGLIALLWGQQITQAYLRGF
jgi:leader peptidase (prepilin peptidase)/N-methyltransferase